MKESSKETKIYLLKQIVLVQKNDEIFKAKKEKKMS